MSTLHARKERKIDDQSHHVQRENLRRISWRRAVVFLACYASKHYVFEGRRGMLL